MKDDDKHKWKEVPLSQSEKSTFDKAEECVKGDCKCRRVRYLVFVYGKPNFSFIYTRGMQQYSYRPTCYGSTPINEQGID